MITLESELKRVREILYQRQWIARNREKVNTNARAWKLANLDKVRTGNKIYRESHKAEASAKAIAWRKANPDRYKEINRRCVQKLRDSGGIKAKYRKERLSKKYGMTLLEWDALFVSQGSKCAICNSPDPSCNYGWHTDHDHTTGKVRGILCNHCNLMIGHAKDDVERMLKGVEYLKAGGVLSLL